MAIEKVLHTGNGLRLVLDLTQEILKFLVFLSNSSLYLSVFVLKPLLIYRKYFSIVQLVFSMLMEDVVPAVKMFAMP